jgi:hypothetical protein
MIKRAVAAAVRRYDEEVARSPWKLALLAFVVFELLWLLVWLLDRSLLANFAS